MYTIWLYIYIYIENNIYTYIVFYISNNFQLQHKRSNLIKDLSTFNLVNIFKKSRM